MRRLALSGICDEESRERLILCLATAPAMPPLTSSFLAPPPKDTSAEERRAIGGTRIPCGRAKKRSFARWALGIRGDAFGSPMSISRERMSETGIPLLAGGGGGGRRSSRAHSGLWSEVVTPFAGHVRLICTRSVACGIERRRIRSHHDGILAFDGFFGAMYACLTLGASVRRTLNVGGKLSGDSRKPVKAWPHCCACKS